MAFKDTIKHMRDLLASIQTDLEKAEGGNKAASQRVRTGTVKLEKIAKVYRKDSVASEKTNKGKKKPAAKMASASKSKSKPKAKTAAPAMGFKSKSAAFKAKPKAK